eukprot:4360426-Prymnesium_polylepis.1
MFGKGHCERVGLIMLARACCQQLVPRVVSRCAVRPLALCAGAATLAVISAPRLPALSQPRLLAAERAATADASTTAVARVDFEVRTPLDALRLLLRAVYLGAVMVPSLLLLLPAYLRPDRFQHRLEAALLRALERGGACMIKVGQWASTRPDMLPGSLCRTLSALHDGAPAHDWRDTERAVATAFSSPLAARFARVDPIPVGSGCIAQVHLGETVEGVPVAIKVLHPGVERLAAMDLRLLRGAAQAVEWVPLPGIRWLALSESVEQFAAFMGRQLDLRHEAANLSRFRRNFEHCRGPEAIEFPRPLEREGLVSSRVLVETAVQGECLSTLLHGARSRI